MKSEISLSISRDELFKSSKSFLFNFSISFTFFKLLNKTLILVSKLVIISLLFILFSFISFNISSKELEYSFKSPIYFENSFTVYFDKRMTGGFFTSLFVGTPTPFSIAFLISSSFSISYFTKLDFFAFVKSIKSSIL